MKQTLRSKGGLCPKPKPMIHLFYKLFLTLIVVLVSCVCSRAQVSASSPEAGPAAGAVEGIKPLKIGDTIPDALWNLPLQMVKAGQEGSTTVTLNDYKGKLIILDFWATWCGSCIKSLDKLNTLQDDLLKDLFLLPVSKEKGNKVRAFLEKKRWHLPSVIDGDILTALFPHRTVPHVVWINKGKVEAITDSRYTNEEFIRDFLNGKGIVENKFELLHFNKDKPDVLNLEGVRPLVVSVLTDHINGAPSYISFTPNRDTSSVFLINTSIVNMLKTVFSTDTVQLLVSDSLARAINYTARENGPDRSTQDWEEYSKSYTLRVSKALSKDQLWQLAQQDLAKFLNLYYGISIQLQREEISRSGIKEKTGREKKVLLVRETLKN